MKQISRFIAVILVFILLIAIPLAILAFDVGRVVFNQPLVKRVVTEIVTESDLIPAALAWFSETRARERYAGGEAEAWVEEPNIVSLIEFMDIVDWREIRWEVLTNKILTEWTSITVGGTYEWIDSDDRVPDIQWSMESFIRLVDSEHGTRSISIAYSALPSCKEDQISDFKTRLAAAPPGTEVLYNLCEFPDPWHEDQFGDYLESLEDLIANIPRRFDLTVRLSRVQDTAGVGPDAIKTQLRLIRWLMKLAPLIPVALLFLILVFEVRSLRSFGQWWGIPLTIGGVFTLLVALTYRPLVTVLLIAGPLSETPELIREEVLSGMLTLASYIFKPMLWQSLAVLAVGLVLILIGSVSKPKIDQIKAKQQAAE
jgi:hypothetical protein